MPGSGGENGSNGKGGGGKPVNEPPDKPPTRTSLAAQAYPGLWRRARRYRRFFGGLIWFLIVWLVITSLLSWDIATGGALLERAKKLDSYYITAAQQAAVTAATPAGKQPTAPAPPGDTRQQDVAPPPPPQGGTAPPKPAAGRGTGALPPADTAAGGTGAAHMSPSEAEGSRLAKYHQNLADHNLMTWLADQSWLRSALCFIIYGDGMKERHTVNIEWADALIGILAGTVLPIFYGVLGAAAAVVRAVSAKMRENTLVPRDLVLAYVQLGLGAVIGACIGLFATADSDSGSAHTGLLGPIPLTASALCFIAGFGVEGVFQALESLIKRVFNIDQPEPS